MALSKNAKNVMTNTKVKGKVKEGRKQVAAIVASAGIRDTQVTANSTTGPRHRHGSYNNTSGSYASSKNGRSDGGSSSGNYDNNNSGKNNHGSDTGNNTDTNINTNTKMAKHLSTTAINIKRREDYANMDPASKDRERTRVKRSRAVKMARDSLPGTAWVELSRRSQVEVADAIASEIRFKYAAATPGPSSRTAADYAVHKVFADKGYLFFPKEKKGNNGDQDVTDDPMDIDSDDSAEMTEDDWTPSELVHGWQDIVGDMPFQE
ncbi:hypothetical protein PG987_007488 [Apiospora arundinis]